ncbi:hypothetical protein GCM10010149_65790 [Nonomuraea roseoviolacea subsp. roseoviolacea]
MTIVATVVFIAQKAIARRPRPRIRRAAVKAADAHGLRVRRIEAWRGSWSARA